MVWTKSAGRSSLTTKLILMKRKSKNKNPGSGKSPLHRAHSSIVVDGYDRAPSRGMLRAVGFKDEDFKKSQIGIASTWSMVTPCNMHIDQLAVKAAKGVDQNGGKAR